MADRFSDVVVNILGMIFTTELTVSRIGLGTFELGLPYEIC